MIKKGEIKNFLLGIVNSYSQVFFSDNKILAGILILVSFFDPNAGLIAFSSVFFTNLIAYHLGFHKTEIFKGLFGFNSLLVGLGIGYYFEASIELMIVVLVSSVLTLLLVTLFKGILMKYGLPYLSIPFLFGIWAVLIASGYFEALGISQKGIYTINKLYGIGGVKLVEFYEKVLDFPMNESLKTYFTSIAAVFFQFNVLSGILVATGILIYSRIAFLLSLYGFYTAYLFYRILGGNIADLSYTYIGFNYILTAIAIGGFYLIPSKKTFIWLLVLIPIVTLLTLSLAQVFSLFQLSIYSLPFNIVVLLFIYALKFRMKPSDDLMEVYYQQNTPEKNLYSYYNQKEKFNQRNMTSFILPFYGKWTVSQAHDGEFTHKEGWRHAWDFVITDEKDYQYKNQGLFTHDYYCYGKSVTAPASGTIEEIVDDIPDNEIGKFNLVNNWGNTIIIKHDDYLFSSLNHLKPGSINVKIGDKIRSGQKIAEVGNSGRSPYPHLHFQLQETPYIGSRTIPYPLSYYMIVENSGFNFKRFTFPEKNEKIFNVDKNPLLKSTLQFKPGQELKVKYKKNGKHQESLWEIKTNTFNNAYFHDQETNSSAYFINDDTLFYFTQFTGDKSSMLYYFYMGFYHVLQAFYKDLEIGEVLPQNKTFRHPLLAIQDFTAAFFIFLKTSYSLKYKKVDNPVQPSSIHLQANLKKLVFNKKLNELNYDITVGSGQIIMNITTPKSKINAEIS